MVAFKTCFVINFFSFYLDEQKIVFAGNIPEMTVLQKYGAHLIDGLGAKIDSSSRIIAEAKNKI